METCYKVFRRDVIQRLPLEENRFGFEPEITAKIARYRRDGDPLRIREVPISYERRSEEHTSELQSPCNIVCRLLLEKKNKVVQVTPMHLRKIAELKISDLNTNFI